MTTYPERIQRALDRARVHISANEPLQAIPELEKAIAKVPKGADGWFLLGQAKGLLDDHIESERCFRQALTLMPKSFDIQYGLALALVHQERYAQAIPIYERALLGNCAPPLNVVHNLASCYLQLDRYEDAIGIYTAILRHTDVADIHALLGMAYQGLHKNRQALDAYEAAAERGLTGYTLNLNSGVCAYGLHDFFSAQRYAEAALEATPYDETALHNLAVAYLGAGDVGEAIATCKQSASPRTVASRLMMMSYLDEYRPSDVRAAHAEAAAAYPRSLAPLDLADYPTTGKIRLGFITGDLREHPVAYFLEGLLAAINRTDFDIHIYYTAADRDAVTDRFVAMACTWHDVAAAEDAAIATAVRDDKIDIAFDLSGNTATGKLGIFAHRSAPAQVSYLGYSSTTGLPEMDYFMTDECLDPVTEGDDDYTERVIRLGNVFATYTPPREEVQAGPLPLASNGHLTLGTFAQASKITADTIALWGAALRAVPTARLQVMSKGMHLPSAQERLQAKLAAVGVDASRITFRAAASMAEYLAAHNEVDVIVDSLPWSGHTTTLHALWMGVPTISLEGSRHVSRFAIEIHRNMQPVGSTEPSFLARTHEEFAHRVAMLASQVPELVALRGSLRGRLLCSPLCDHRGMAARFEAACRDIYSASRTAAFAEPGR